MKSNKSSLVAKDAILDESSSHGIARLLNISNDSLSVLVQASCEFRAIAFQNSNHKSGNLASKSIFKKGEFAENESI